MERKMEERDRNLRALLSKYKQGRKKIITLKIHARPVIATTIHQ